MLQKRRTVVVQRRAFRPFSSVTDTGHEVLAPPALWFEGLSGAPRHVRWRFCRQHQRQWYWICDLWGNPTKTCQGGLCMKWRVVQPKMFATGGQRCFFELFKTLLEWRPKEMWNSGLFYLAVNEWPKTQVWCKWKRMGVNSINSFMKNMASQVDIQGKKLTNHSTHKTLVKKLKAANQLRWVIISVCQWEVPWRLWRRWWEWTVRHFFHHQCRVCNGTIQQSSSTACKD